MPIIKVTDVSRGLNADLSPEELQVGTWSNVTNMRFQNGYAQRFNGTASVFSAPSVTPYYVQAFQAGTARYWIHAGLQKVFADDGATRTEITPAALFTGDVDSRWSGDELSGVLVMTNGVDQPVFWGGNVANDLATLTGWNAGWRCNILKSFKNYLVAFDITKTATRYPAMVKWSHTAVPGAIPTSWDETDVTKDAGEQDLSETPGAIVDALPLGDAMVIYKESSMYLMRFIGAPYTFQFQRIPGDFGMLAKGCGVETPVGHVVMTAGDVVVNTGQGVQSIADGMVRKFIFYNLNTSNYKRCFVTSNPQKNEVLVCFPLGDAEVCTMAAVWNWNSKTWGLRSINATYGATGLLSFSTSGSWDADAEPWDLDVSTWNQNEYSPNEQRLLLSEPSRISAFDVAAGDDGSTNITGVLERTGITFDDPSTVKLVRGLIPRIDAPAGTVVTIEVGGAMSPNLPPTWSAPVSFTVGQDERANAFASGRFIAVRFTASRPWRMRSFDADIVGAGMY